MIKAFRKVLYLSLILTFLPVFAFSLTSENEVYIFNELSYAYNSGFYPGVVQYAQKLQDNFPLSQYLGASLVMKAESLFRLNQIEEAEKVLDYCEDYLDGETLKNHCLYWKGKVLDSKLENNEAIEYFYSYCKSGEKQYFSDSILSSANIYYRISSFEKAVPLFEYVVENGNLYENHEYATSLLKLCDSYNKNKNPEKTIALYNKINKDDFDASGMENNVYFLFIEYAGEAYELKGDFKKAYELYCKVLSSGEKALAPDALKKAYIVSANHKSEVGSEAGVILENAQKSLNENPELLGEFWTRLAYDAYENGDYKKALNYFDQAEKNAPIELFLFANLYRAQIAAGRTPTEKSAQIAENMILSSRGILNEENQKIWYRESNILLTRYAAIQKNWENVKKYGACVNPLDEDTRYFLALAYYNTKNYEESKKLLKTRNIELQALNYARLNDLRNSAFVYENIRSERELTQVEQLNLSKVLLMSGRYKEAQIEAAKCNLPEAKYILGLSQFNTWSWKYAEENLKSFLKSTDSSSSDYFSYAKFYLGYSQYRLGKTQEAYENLNDFVTKFPSHELIWSGLVTAANSCIQNKKYELAQNYAELAIEKCREENIEETVLLCADIYIDSKKYEKALSLLNQFSNRKDIFGMKCVYKIGQVNEKQNDLYNADVNYKKVYDDFSDNKLAEEALYRRGEMFYNAKKYSDAVKRFEEYAKKYPFGNFVDASWYFTAESLYEVGNIDRAILQNQALIKKFPESPYVYSTIKNLIKLYRHNYDYEKALENANLLYKLFDKQAENDGILKEIADLKKLCSGKSEEIVKKENEYHLAGEEKSAGGRNAGTELVALYSKNDLYVQDAVKLAEKLLPIQQKNLSSECYYASQNAFFLGKSYRFSGKNKESAQMYLLASEYFRMANDSDSAAASLYGSYDSFRAGGLPGDANETAKMLQKLYPESRYAKNVKVQ